MKIKILKYLLVFFVTLVLSAVAFRALFISNIQWDNLVCILASLLGISIVSLIVTLLAQSLRVKTFFKWLSIISFIPIVYFVAFCAHERTQWVYFKLPPPRSDLRFLHIEIKTNSSENERTVCYVWGDFFSGQKYKVNNGLVYGFGELHPFRDVEKQIYSRYDDTGLYYFFYVIENDIRKRMKPYRWLPARTKIDKNAPIVIHGRGIQGTNDCFYWSGSFENAPNGITNLIEMLDQKAQLITPTNGLVFVQAIPNNKSSETKKQVLMSGLLKEGIIYDAIRHPYRLQLVNRNDFLGSLVDNFQPINKSYDASYGDAHFNIRFLPYSVIENGIPHPVLEHTPQGIQQ